MFTGIVETLAMVKRIVPEPPGCRLVIDARSLVEGARIGQSIAVNGCCLTVVEIAGSCLSFQAGPETLARANLGSLQVGSPVNLERAMQLSDRLDGHLVTGHVDGVGQLAQRVDEADWSTCWFTAAPVLLRQMASKGSIAIDGVSLTLVEVTDEQFSVALIPHTLAITTIGQLKVGQAVNLETDLLAKYVARLLNTKHLS
jgi:riboflavin synthase